jgi:hypothetical protein
MIAVDTSSSLTSADIGNLESDANDLANQLAGEGARVGGLTFGGTSVDNFTPLSDSPVQFSGLSQQGSTPMPAALEVAAEELDVNGRSGAETYIVMFTDGGPNYPNSGYDSFPIGGGFTPGDYTSGDSSNSIVEDGELCETANIAADIRADHDILTVGIDDDGAITNNPVAVDCDGNSLSSLGEYLQNDIAGGMDNYYAADSAGTVSSILTDIVSDISMPEQVFRRGTLQDDLAALQAGAGIPLDGDLTTAFDELDDAPDSDGRDCFDPGVTYYIGFGWWLPSDIGNEVQGDSVSFDLGFYTEQCRNNDGSGPS